MNSRKWIAVAMLCLVAGSLVSGVIRKSSAPTVTADTGQSGLTEPGTAAEQPTDSAGTSSDTDSSVQMLTAVDRTLPEFELSGTDSSVWNTEVLRGKPWIINFWATWCPPCVEEIPSMNAAYEILQPQGVGMLAINAGEGAEAVAEFLQQVPIEFPNILGDNDTLADWSVRALPTTLVVNAEGRILFEALGPRHWDDEALLQRIVDAL